MVLLLALATPLDVSADHYLFTAHMVQHLLLTLVAAPLLLIGTPGWLLRAAAHGDATDRLRAPGAPSAGRVLRLQRGVRAGARAAFYELTLANEPLHALEHLVFLARLC